MTTKILNAVLLLACCLYISSCIVVSQSKSWRYRQLLSKTEPANPFIEIKLQRPTTLLTLPLIFWEVNTAKNYFLDIDFHTKDIEYERLDSISYEIQNSDRQPLATGVLPIVNGELSYRSYSPNVHRAQCTTQPLIVLDKQRRQLVGTFIIYATNINNQKDSVSIKGVPLRYFKARVGSFF